MQRIKTYPGGRIALFANVGAFVLACGVIAVLLVFFLMNDTSGDPAITYSTPEYENCPIYQPTGEPYRPEFTVEIHSDLIAQIAESIRIQYQYDETLLRLGYHDVTKSGSLVAKEIGVTGVAVRDTGTAFSLESPTDTAQALEDGRQVYYPISTRAFVWTGRSYKRVNVFAVPAPSPSGHGCVIEDVQLDE